MMEVDSRRKGGRARKRRRSSSRRKHENVLERTVLIKERGCPYTHKNTQLKFTHRDAAEIAEQDGFRGLWYRHKHTHSHTLTQTKTH
jgi:hypothetical protein